jgi:thiamine-monophosphate kinase
MKSELDFVNYLKKIKTFNKNIIEGIGDDCAIVKFSSRKKYVITSDTSLLGPHFSKDYTPEEIGHKSLATNLSDIASMGCVPLYALYDITIPRISESWIKRFFDGTRKLLNQHKVSIIGGDTTKGPMSISITLIGVQKNKILTRSGAKTGHDIYVTGNIGSARAALILDKKTKGYKYFRKSLVMPLPRVSVGLELSEFASSCIDISDGLAKDLKSIAISSKKGFQVDVDSIPTDPKFDIYVEGNLKEQCILGGGEDYELCFTANKKYIRKINNISNKYKIKITRIGVIKSVGYRYSLNSKQYNPKVSGYDHFKGK